ncbi:MAG: hypothetical protein AB1405_17625, partial [Bdellovibrionota bacterium]
VYLSRSLSAAAIPLSVLLAQGMVESGKRFRFLFSLVFVPLFFGSLAAMKVERHPAFPAYLEQAVKLSQEAGGGHPVYVHPGEFASVLEMGGHQKGVHFGEVWREGPLTLWKFESLVQEIPDEDARVWAEKIAAEKACLLSVTSYNYARDPRHKLETLLKEAHGYRELDVIRDAPFLCPPDR